MLSKLFSIVISGSLIFTPIVSEAKYCVYGSILYDDSIDYRHEMYACAVLGDETSLALGSIYEEQRNAKLKALGRPEEVTSYFHPGKSGKDIAVEMISEEMKREYQVAGVVYERLRKAGFTDVSIAGVLGNMMNECGGNTLDLSPFVYEYEYGKHYGLCQWSIVYSPEINGADVDTQLDYLVDTIGDVMEQFGGSFETFNALESSSEAGRYFANYYERGGHTRQRELNAEKAYGWVGEYTNVRK